jgi:cytochrome c biogenesis protein CcdA
MSDVAALVGVLLVFLAVGAVAGGATWALTRWRAGSIAAGVVALLAAARHALEAFGQAVGEYEGELTGYDKLVDEQFWALVAGSVVVPVVVVVLVHLVWRRGLRGRRHP